MGVAPVFSGLTRSGRTDMADRFGRDIGREGQTALIVAPVGVGSAASRGCGRVGRPPGPNRRDRVAAGCGSTRIGRPLARSLRPCRTRPPARSPAVSDRSPRARPATEGRGEGSRAGPSRIVDSRSESVPSGVLRLAIPARNGLTTEAAPTPAWAVREDAACPSCPTCANNQEYPLVNPSVTDSHDLLDADLLVARARTISASCSLVKIV